ncbi:MAG: phosphoribosyl-ATP diphosphatase [Bacillota bacterium]|nr:phosphoribosyl-ATP diphosphatase [Bacillota bacterium]
MSEMGAMLDQLYDVVIERRDRPRDGSYTNYLLERGVDKICKKIGEESTEVVIAAKNGSNSELVYEIADLFYHLCVLMVDQGVTFDEIEKELRSRRS